MTDVSSGIEQALSVRRDYGREASRGIGTAESLDGLLPQLRPLQAGKPSLRAALQSMLVNLVGLLPGAHERLPARFALLSLLLGSVRLHPRR